MDVWKIWMVGRTNYGIQDGDTPDQVRRQIMKLTDMIELNPRVCGGTPVICGTRIPVSVLIGQLAGGVSWAACARAIPTAELTDAAISAALLFAKHSIEHSEFKFAEAI